MGVWTALEPDVVTCAGVVELLPVDPFPAAPARAALNASPYSNAPISGAQTSFGSGKVPFEK